MPSEKPQLWRNPVKIEGQPEDMPQPSEGPPVFGTSDASTTITIDKVLSGIGDMIRDQCSLELRAWGLSDHDGVVLGASIVLRGKDGRQIEHVSVALDEADARAVVNAVSALIPLTEKPRE